MSLFGRSLSPFIIPSVLFGGGPFDRECLYKPPAWIRWVWSQGYTSKTQTARSLSSLFSPTESLGGRWEGSSVPCCSHLAVTGTACLNLKTSASVLVCSLEVECYFSHFLTWNFSRFLEDVGPCVGEAAGAIGTSGVSWAATPGTSNTLPKEQGYCLGLGTMAFPLRFLTSTPKTSNPKSGIWKHGYSLRLERGKVKWLLLHGDGQVRSSSGLGCSACLRSPRLRIPKP